jgi:small subunit ribosomal protein S10
MEIKPNEKIRVRLESFNHELLNTSCQKIMDITQNNNVDNVGVVSLPTDKRIYCVLRSPHVNKDSREHFEIRIHKRILEIYYDSSVFSASLCFSVSISGYCLVLYPVATPQ